MNFTSEIMNEIFDFSKNYALELKCRNCLARSNILSTHFGIDSVANITAKVWNKIPNKIKDAGSLTIIKSEIKTWLPQGCP